MKKTLAVVMTAVLTAGMTISAFAGEDLADKKIALLLPGSIDDQGWNATNNAGALAAEEELGVKIDVVESVPAEEYESTFTEYAEKGYDLIMAAGSQWDESATVVARTRSRYSRRNMRDPILQALSPATPLRTESSP